MTGMPHRPSSSDGHLLRFVSSFLTLAGYRKEDARRYRSPYRVRLSARTVRHD